MRIAMRGKDRRAGIAGLGRAFEHGRAEGQRLAARRRRARRRWRSGAAPRSAPPARCRPRTRAWPAGRSPRISAKARSSSTCARAPWRGSPIPDRSAPGRPSRARPAASVAGRERGRWQAAAGRSADLTGDSVEPVPAGNPPPRGEGRRRQRARPAIMRISASVAVCGSRDASAGSGGLSERRRLRGGDGGRELGFLAVARADGQEAGSIRAGRPGLRPALAEHLVEVPARRQVERHVGAGRAALPSAAGSASRRPRPGWSAGVTRRCSSASLRIARVGFLGARALRVVRATSASAILRRAHSLDRPLPSAPPGRAAA